MSKARNIADIGSDDVISTSSTGIDVTGTVTADGLTVDGSLGDLQVSTGGNQLSLTYNGNNYINTTGNGSALNFRMTSAYTQAMKINSNNDISFYEDTGTTAKFFWDASAESLGIGTVPTAKLHVKVNSTTNVEGVLIESADSGSTSAPDLALYRNSASPADDDIVGALWFYGNNSADEQTIYGAILGYSEDVTDATEDGSLRFLLTKAGSVSQEAMRLTPANIAFPDLGATTTTIGVTDAASNYFNTSGRGSLILKASSAVSGSQAQSGGRLVLEAGNSHNGQSGQVYIRAGKNLVNNAKAEIIFQQGLVESARLGTKGSLLLGTSTELAALTVASTTAVAYTANFTGQPANGYNLVLRANAGLPGGTAVRIQNHLGTEVGTITYSTTATSYITSSDYRLKTDAQPMTGASARVQALNPVNFEWIADGTRVDGFLAHEAATVVPESVSGTKDAMVDEEYEVTAAVEATYDDNGNELTEAVDAVIGTRSVPKYQGIDQSKLVPLLTAALQEALTKIDTLEAQNATFETRLTALEAV